LLICGAAAQSLLVGLDPGSNETVVIDSGTYSTALVGIAGNGTLINNGAVLHGLALGTASGGVGTYIQNGSSTLVSNPTGWLEIGAMYGTGHVIQNDGVVDYSSGLVLVSFHNFDSDASYTLNGGALYSGTTSVGSYTAGTFIQTGGLHQTNYLRVANYGVGTYLLSGGTLQATGNETMSHGSFFAQTGGLNTTPVLGVGSYGLDFPDTYALSGGSLLTGRLYVSRTQSFIQTGGFLSISQGFSCDGGDATFGNAAWAGGATFETHGGSQTLTVDSGSQATRNLSMTLFAFPGYPPGRGDPRVTFESSQHLASLTIYAGSVTLTPGDDKVLESNALTDGGKIDLNDNELRWDFPYNGPNPIGIVRNLIASARYAGGGVWKGGGITSSMADATTFGLGYWSKFDYIAVHRTFYGDANGDGTVDVSDLEALATHWQTSNNFWAGGDFNYDGVVDASDLSLLALNWQAGAGSLADEIAALGLPDIQVPEPGGILILLIALSAAGLWHGGNRTYNRRRREHRCAAQFRVSIARDG
jgi:hypothetical protein